MHLITWNQKLGRAECPYAYRWVINFGLFAIRLHHFVRSDDSRALHDHPYWFITFILCGSYDDVSDKGTVRLKAGRIAFRRAIHKHTVKTRGVWTLLITGRESRVWGFWPNGKFKRREKYFKKYGHHPCEQP